MSLCGCCHTVVDEEVELFGCCKSCNDNFNRNPTHCEVCGTERDLTGLGLLVDHKYVCSDCYAEARLASAGTCKDCGTTTYWGETLCSHCKDEHFYMLSA